MGLSAILTEIGREEPEWLVWTNTSNDFVDQRIHYQNFLGLVRDTQADEKRVLQWLLAELLSRVSRADIGNPPFRVIIIEKSLDHLPAISDTLYESGVLSLGYRNIVKRLVLQIDDALWRKDRVYKAMHVRKGEQKAANDVLTKLPLPGNASSLRRFFLYYNRVAMCRLNYDCYINADLYSEGGSLKDKIKGEIRKFELEMRAGERENPR